MGQVQCMSCRLELPCSCQGQLTRDAASVKRLRGDADVPYHERVMQNLGMQPRRSKAVKPGELGEAAQKRLWDAMMREQREGSDNE